LIYLLLSDKPPKSANTYMETDLDTQKSSDLSHVQEVLMSYQDVSLSQTSPTVTVRALGGNFPLQEAPLVRSVSCHHLLHLITKS